MAAKWVVSVACVPACGQRLESRGTAPLLPTSRKAEELRAGREGALCPPRSAGQWAHVCCLHLTRDRRPGLETPVPAFTSGSPAPWPTSWAMRNNADPSRHDQLCLRGSRPFEAAVCSTIIDKLISAWPVCFPRFPFLSRLLCGDGTLAAEALMLTERSECRSCPVSAGLWKVKSWQDLNNNRGPAGDEGGKSV